MKKSIIWTACLIFMAALTISCNHNSSNDNGSNNSNNNLPNDNTDPFDYESQKTKYGELTITGGSYKNEDGIITLGAPDEENLEMEFVISGYFNGQIINTTKNAKLTLNNAFIENTSGNPAILGQQKTLISLAKDTTNYLITKGGESSKNGVITCYDSVADKSKNMELGGSGTAYIFAETGHGIKADDAEFKGSGTYNIIGNSDSSAVNCNTFTIKADKSVVLNLKDAKNGIKADKNITIASGTVNISNATTGLKTDTLKDDGQDIHFITVTGATITYDNVETPYKTEKDKYTE
ncbi:MAG: carbohydrate-binding domain-containing protein [Treponema sp.]|nr:carbohydrate-binding domain-containing protein [Treponema sp.]